ncbi:MAG: hypothetical protein P0116_10360 [Candidatus Nitrosocosmicus sp.]|nr:hypothetical protein [Candidatus Nitrosocosmicus sp.]
MKSLDISSRKVSQGPLIISIIMMTVLFIDFYFSTIANIIVPFAESYYGLHLLIMIIATIAGLIIYFLNNSFCNSEGKELRILRNTKNNSRYSIGLYALGIILLDILLENKYYTINIISIVTISYSCSIRASLWVS